MRLRVHAILIGCAWFAFPHSAWSAQAPNEAIVVTGEPPEKAREDARSYVKELGVAPGEQQAARWLDPVCPRAIGIAKEHQQIVEEQLRRIIRDVGAPLAKPGCAANFTLAFTDGAGAVVRHIARRDPGVVREVPPSDVRRLKDGAAPVRWWYSTEPRTRDGASVVTTEFLPGVQIEGNAYGTLPAGRGGALLQRNPSIVGSQIIRSIHAATVVIDVKQAEGVPLKSVVDYAALVGLAEIKLDAAPARSVLSLFQPGGERRLTRRDTAFLTALYRIPMDRRSEQQRRSIVGEMVKRKAAN
jgi:hypothetical protein